MRVAGRLLTIHRVLVRYGLDDYVRATHLYRPLRFVFWLSPWTWFRRRRGTRGERLRRALEDLGPIFVKFGQVVSTRRDLLPPDIADELAKLQDRVPPFDGTLAKARIEASLGRPVAGLFASFDVAPLAAASIAQVHAATLPDGREVVVKVLRPGMREAIDLDLEVLHALAGLAEEYWPDSRRLRPREVVVEYEKTILNELDLMREAGNASQLKRNFAGSPLLHVPEVYWDLCRQDVMVMERIRGIPISEVARLRELGTDIPKLAENGVEIFFTQVFRHNFFHADMHPGNIFVDVADPAKPRYAAVDFGIIGTLEPRDQLYLAGNFLAFFERDYRRVAVLHLESGWVPGRHARGRARVRRAHGLRADLRQAAQGHLVRHRADAPVRGRAPLRDAGPAPADPAAEDAAQHRGPRPAALSRARPVEDGAADPARLDARAREPAHGDRQACASTGPTSRRRSRYCPSSPVARFAAPTTTNWS